MNDFDTPWAAEIGDFEIYSKSAGDAIAYAENPKIRDFIIECVNGFEEIKRQRDDATFQLARICEDGFGNQDTIGQEPAADYVLRQITRLTTERDMWQAECEKMAEALRTCKSEGPYAYEGKWASPHYKYDTCLVRDALASFEKAKAHQQGNNSTTTGE